MRQKKYLAKRISGWAKKWSGYAGKEQSKSKWAHIESMIVGDWWKYPPTDDITEDSSMATQHSKEEVVNDPSISQKKMRDNMNLQSITAQRKGNDHKKKEQC